MRKRYDVKGMMEWHPVFKAGRTRLQVSFTGGHMCGGANTPASFETADPVVQTVIESSEAFRSGRIRIGMTVEQPTQPTPSETTAAPVAASGGGLMTVVEYESTTRASDFLHFEKGIPLEKVITKAQCINEARRLGIDLRIKGSDLP